MCSKNSYKGRKDNKKASLKWDRDMLSQGHIHHSFISLHASQLLFNIIKKMEKVYTKIHKQLHNHFQRNESQLMCHGSSMSSFPWVAMRKQTRSDGHRHKLLEEKFACVRDVNLGYLRFVSTLSAFERHFL